VGWENVPDWISALSNFGVAVAAGFAAWQGVQSLRAWREEAVGRRRMELAEQTLADFWRARDIYRMARSPLVWAEELDDDRGGDGARRAREELAVLKRLARENAFLQEFQARQYRFVAIFGEEARRAYDLVRDAHNSIFAAVQTMDGLARDGEYYRTFRNIAFHTPDDDIERKIEEAVKLVEDICRPAIRVGVGMAS